MAKNKEKTKGVTRPPVVVVLGHVDHGKSSLLECVRDVKITAQEAGGITQHIGAYEVEHPSPGSGQARKITFIDTPGHEAFSAMRSRGAQVADIAILVVAADDGVKPQTKEAIKHILQAGIPMIVAFNKIDLPTIDIAKAKRELTQNDVLVESEGGKVPSVEVSAKEKKGIPELLEMILLVADLEHLTGDAAATAAGVIVESYIDTKRGPVATVIVQKGMLRAGDVLGTNTAVGKVKGMEDFQGKTVTEAPLSMPVVVLGFETVPGVGETVSVFAAAKAAEAAAQQPVPEKAAPAVIATEPDQRVLNVILKVDVAGSLEAVEEVLKDLPQDKVLLRILKAEVGDINETDVRLALSGKARIFGFRVKADPIAKSLAQNEKIKLKVHDVIYELAQDVREALSKRVASEKVRVELGAVKILEIFKADKNRQVIGGRVTEGEITKGTQIDIYRGEENRGSGKIMELQKNKKETKVVEKGTECGMLFDSEVAIEKGDMLMAFREEMRKGEL